MPGGACLLTFPIWQVLALAERRPEPPARRVCAPTGGVSNWSDALPYQECAQFDYQAAVPPRNYPLQQRSEAWNFDHAVRGRCDGCVGTGAGGYFNRSCRVTLSSPTNASIVYIATAEDDGRAASPRPYTGPFELRRTTDVEAFTVTPNGSAMGLRATFRYALHTSSDEG